MYFRALQNGANFCAKIFIRNPGMDFWKSLLFFTILRLEKQVQDTLPTRFHLVVYVLVLGDEFLFS